MYAMQVDTATSSTGGQTRHPSPFPFQEAAARIIELFNVATQTEKHTAFINYAHDRATELQMGWATLADLRRQPVGCNVLLWSFLIPRNCKTQLVKLASRFLMFLYVDHLPPEERKRWVLRHADWAGIHESGAAYRTPEEFAAWYFDGQAYKNSKRMCVDLSRRTRAHQAPPQQLAQHSQLPQLPLWPPTQQATEMTWMMVAQQLAFAPFIVPPVPVAPAPVQYIHQSCDEKQQATDCAPFIECQSAPSPAMGFAPEEQRTDTDVDQYIRSPLTPSRGPAFPMTVPSYQVAAAADDFQPSVASPMGANDMPSLEALANEPQYLLDNLDEWMQC